MSESADSTAADTDTVFLPIPSPLLPFLLSTSSLHKIAHDHQLTHWDILPPLNGSGNDVMGRHRYYCQGQNAKRAKKDVIELLKGQVCISYLPFFYSCAVRLLFALRANSSWERRCKKQIKKSHNPPRQRSNKAHVLGDEHRRGWTRLPHDVWGSLSCRPRARVRENPLDKADVWIETDDDGLPVLWKPPNSPPYEPVTTATNGPDDDDDDDSEKNNDSSKDNKFNQVKLRRFDIMLNAPPLSPKALSDPRRPPDMSQSSPTTQCTHWTSLSPSHIDQITTLARSLGDGLGAHPELVIPLSHVDQHILGTPSTEYILHTFDNVRNMEVEALVKVERCNRHPPIAIVSEKDATSGILPRHRPCAKLKLLEWDRVRKPPPPFVAIPLAFWFDLAAGHYPAHLTKIEFSAGEMVHKVALPVEAETLIEGSCLFEASDGGVESDVSFSSTSSYGEEGEGIEEDEILRMLGTSRRFTDWRITSRTRWVASDWEAIECANRSSGEGGEAELRFQRRASLVYYSRDECYACPELPCTPELLEWWLRLAGELRGPSWQTAGYPISPASRRRDYYDVHTTAVVASRVVRGEAEVEEDDDDDSSYAEEDGVSSSTTATTATRETRSTSSTPLSSSSLGPATPRDGAEWMVVDASSSSGAGAWYNRKVSATGASVTVVASPPAGRGGGKKGLGVLIEEEHGWGQLSS
jgi:hypothetical protein